MSDALTIDESHVYRINGRVVPGVTEIIKDVGLSSSWRPDDWYMDRGSAVHLAIQYWLDRTLDEDGLDLRIDGYLQGFKRFWGDHKPNLLASEKMVYDPIRCYAGTQDLDIEINGVRCQPDIKTGAPEKWHPYQTAGYTAAACPETYKYIRRFGLYLKEDGNYRIVEHKNLDDFSVFFSAVNIYHAKRK